MHGIKKHDNVGNKACYDNSHANNKCNHNCVNTVLSARIELYIQDAGKRTVFAHHKNILLTNSKTTRSSYKISIVSFLSPMLNDIVFCMTSSQFSMARHLLYIQHFHVSCVAICSCLLSFCCPSSFIHSPC
eukprot:1037719_1